MMTRFSLITMSAVCAAGILVAFPARAGERVQVVLLGDSTVRTSYLPAGEQHHEVLQAALNKAAPKQGFKVANWADNGEFIPRYLIKGRYDRHRKSGIRPDVAILRFGINDQKYSGVEEFTAHVRTMADLLIADFPGIAVMLETGPFVDFPTRYNYDRESVLAPYWEAVRKLAEERGFTLIDFHAASQKATAEGHWDQRIRLTDRKTEPYVFDNRLDGERGRDVKWFSDIHPNPEGVRIAVETEVPALVEWTKERKSSVATANGANAEPRDYALLLKFSPERFDRRASRGVPQDHLQKAVDP